jgi:hypothetical protein
MTVVVFILQQLQTVQRDKFPIKTAFAMTINKSRGQTRKGAGIYLQLLVISRGQLYVAFDNVAIAVIECIDNAYKMVDRYRETLYYIVKCFEVTKT